MKKLNERKLGRWLKNLKVARDYFVIHKGAPDTRK
jgi:aryl-alcohol dehydrogenase-like predicted oxidoreductase